MGVFLFTTLYSLAMISLLIRLGFCLLIFFGPLAHAAPLPEDRSVAVVYAYFGIADGDAPRGDRPSLPIDSFQQQIDEIASGDYHVVALDDIAGMMRDEKILPPLSVALTFDGIDPYFLSDVAPMLIKRGWPFAVFITPGDIDDNTRAGRGVTWDDLKKLSAKKGVTLGLTSYHYARMTSLDPGAVAADINRARSVFRDQMGRDVDYFAYPFGLSSAAVRRVVEKQGFRAVFTQASGVVYAGSDVLALPRFTMTDDLGDLDRFRLTSHALPLPVSDVEPKDMTITANPPVIGFTVSPAISKQAVKHIVCFASGVGKIKTQVLGERRVEIRLDNGFTDDKARVNCTLAADDDGNRDVAPWRWAGFLFSVPDSLIVKGEDASLSDSPGEE